MDNAFCKTFSKNMDFIPTCAFLYCLAMYVYRFIVFSYLKPLPVFQGDVYLMLKITRFTNIYPSLYITQWMG